MTARPINYLFDVHPPPVLFFYRRELAVELVEELLVAEASRSLIRHGDDCLLVSRSPDPRLKRFLGRGHFGARLGEIVGKAHNLAFGRL